MVKCHIVRATDFEADYLVTSCFKLVAANLLSLTWEENKEFAVVRGGLACVAVIVTACMCMHMQESKMSHHRGAAAEFIQLAIEG